MSSFLLQSLEGSTMKDTYLSWLVLRNRIGTSRLEKYGCRLTYRWFIGSIYHISIEYDPDNLRSMAFALRIADRINPMSS